MSLSRELLMRYHDGELSEVEARRVEAALEHEPAAAEELEAYTELGSFVRAWDESNTAQFDISEQVLAAIEPKRARVHLLPRVATWVSLGVAIAAGSVLVVRSWSAPPAARGGHAAASASESASPLIASAAPDAVALQVEEAKPPPATIESVDFGSRTGSVFVVSTGSSETPVVWMPDDAEPDEDKEDRSKSL